MCGAQCKLDLRTFDAETTFPARMRSDVSATTPVRFARGQLSWFSMLCAFARLIGREPNASRVSASVSAWPSVGVTMDWTIAIVFLTQ